MAKDATYEASYEERHTAAALALGLAAMTAYLVVVTVRALTDDAPLAEVAWQGPLLLCIGAGGFLYTVTFIALRVRSRGHTVTDERDDRIRAAGEQANSSIVGLAVLATLVMLALDVPVFWVANVLLLTTWLGTLAQAGVVMSGYRKGLA
ncbi:hypothetical protein ON058_02110 [Demequina sp. B12]|uniref:hypothetical protein n=1 Tax=Demequina sp. B12 TaxID=2992757 RepID=UPI00237A695E|nr:hypothetical protein [Demequina sp. B12]MDE0572205.1 hypothetical protein [Demequina sp. B12]